MNACIHELNTSKYTESTAGTPICKNGILPSMPGSQPRSTVDSPAKAAYTSADITVPDTTLPK